MKNNDCVTHENFLLFCARNYNNTAYPTTEDFQEDLMRFKYIKKLITRYIDNNDLKERLILNHIIILANVFKPDVLCKIFWVKMPEYLQYIKPFLIMLNLLPEQLYNGSEIIYTDDIVLDQGIVNALRKIRNGEGF